MKDMFKKGVLKWGTSFSPSFGLILTYHRVVDSLEPGFRGPYGEDVNLSAFRRQMEYITEHFRVLSVERFVEVLTGEESPGEPLVAVTVDDGYENTREVILPILDEYDVPITVFLSTAAINGDWYPFQFPLFESIQSGDGRVVIDGSTVEWTEDIESKKSAYYQIKELTRSYDRISLQSILDQVSDGAESVGPDDLFMDWADVRSLLSHDNVDVGSHGHDHLHLAHVDRETVKQDLQTSREQLVNKLDITSPALAYPYGDYDVSLENDLNIVGFDVGFTTDDRSVRRLHGTFPLFIPRVAQPTIGELKRIGRKAGVS